MNREPRVLLAPKAHGSWSAVNDPVSTSARSVLGERVALSQSHLVMTEVVGAWLALQGRNRSLIRPGTARFETQIRGRFKKWSDRLAV
jgi:hypothetical protein